MIYFVFVIGLGFIEGHSLRESTDEIKEKAVTVYMVMFVFKPFHVTGHFLYLLETAESLSFSDVSRWYRRRPMTRNKLNVTGNMATITV